MWGQLLCLWDQHQQQWLSRIHSWSKQVFLLVLADLSISGRISSGLLPTKTVGLFSSAFWAGKPGKNLAPYCTRPKEDLISAILCGELAFWTADTFSSLGTIPLLLKSCPNDVIFGSLNCHVFSFRVIPRSLRRRRTASRFSSCSMIPHPWMIRSSAIFAILLQPINTSLTIVWYFSGPEVIPNINPCTGKDLGV